MTFVHNAPDFPELVRIAAQARGLAPGLVEKDYWGWGSLKRAPTFDSGSRRTWRSAGVSIA
jgi:hypothetical protein